MKLDVIIPIYNNEKNIRDFYNELHELLKDTKHTIIFIDNSSTDNSYNILKELYKKDDEHIKIISLSKPFNKNSAILAGLKYTKGDYICISDINCSPKYILKSYSFINDNNEYDCVCYCNKNINSNFIRKILIKYTNKVTNIKNIDECSNIIIMKKNVLPVVIETANCKGYSNAIYSLIGFNIYYDYSYNGPTTKDDLLNYIFNYSFRPLKILGNCGIFIVILSFIYLICSLFLSYDKLSLFIFLLILFNGLNIYVLSIIGNYLARLIKRDCIAPKYIIKEKLGFDENYL